MHKNNKNCTCLFTNEGEPQSCEIQNVKGIGLCCQVKAKN